MKMPGVRFLRDRTASAATEMALITPLLVTLLFGGFEAGYYFWNAHKMVKAVRDGSRFAGRMPFDAYDCSGGGVFASPAVVLPLGASGNPTVEQAIKNVTRTGAVDGNNPVMVPGWTNAQVTVQIMCGATDAGGGSMATGIFKDSTDVIRVRIVGQATYQPLFSTLGFATGGIGLRAASQAVVMGL